MRTYLFFLFLITRVDSVAQINECLLSVELQLPDISGNVYKIEIVDFQTNKPIININSIKNFDSHLFKITTNEPLWGTLILKSHNDSILTQIAGFLLTEDLTKIIISDFSGVDKAEGGENEFINDHRYLLFVPPSYIATHPLFSLGDIKKNYSYSPIIDGTLYAYVKEYERNVLSIVKAHRNSYFVLYNLFLRRNYLSTQLLEECCSIISNNLLNTTVGKNLLDYIDNSKSLFVGKKFQDSQLLSLTGKTEQIISKFSNRVTLIDFWASWCGPCRRSIQNLQALYPKIDTSKFSILLISIDTNFEKWQQASKEDHIFLMNYIDKNYQKKEIENKYNLNYIPQNYLVDANGKIIESNIASEKLEEFLQTHNLLRKK